MAAAFVGFSRAKPGAVLLLQCELDLRHHVVHFGVRQGALGAAESQGEGDALVALRNLRPPVLVERPCALQEFASGLFDRGQQRGSGCARCTSAASRMGSRSISIATRRPSRFAPRITLGCNSPTYPSWRASRKTAAQRPG